MLTSGQCVIAAYLTDGDVICPSCADKRIDFDYEVKVGEALDAFEEREGRSPTWSEEHDIEKKVKEARRQAEEDADLRPLIQYDLDSDETWHNDGLYCGNCGEVLVEPCDPRNRSSCIECGASSNLDSKGRCPDCALPVGDDSDEDDNEVI